MNIIVIGLGSMGKRRIRLLQNHFNECIVTGLDSNEERALQCKKEFQIETYTSLDEAIKVNNIDCAFVCTSPLSHNRIIQHCLSHHLHVFTELNLVNDGYKENVELAKKYDLTLFLSSTALYRNEIKYIVDQVKNSNRPVNYSYHVGQYLPDWHPWEKIEDYFISDKRTNGCREILAIELPWIIEAFGKIVDLKVISSKVTELNIDYHDNYMILMKHENAGQGVFIVDVVCREAVRNLEVFSENLYIEWKGKPDSLKSKNISTKEFEPIKLYDTIDRLEGYSSTIIENQYLAEMNDFFDVIKNKTIPRYDFIKDYYTLEVIDIIEKISNSVG